MYSDGAEAFWGGWQEFTWTETPAVINRSPRLMLVAKAFGARTAAALDFLIENGLPVVRLPVTFYRDQNDRLFLDVESEYEPQFSQAAASPAVRRPVHAQLDGRRPMVRDLLDAELLQAGDDLEWRRRNLDVTYHATSRPSARSS